VQHKATDLLDQSSLCLIHKKGLTAWLALYLSTLYMYNKK